jgi:hypothetical protein
MALVRKVIPQLDLFGFLLFIPSAVMILLALQFGSGNTFAWDSATIVGLLVGGVVMAIIFIAWEWRMGELAMLPGNLIKQRVVWTSAGFGMGNMVCVIAASNYLPTYFQAVRADSPTMSGVHVLPSILSQLLCVVTSGALSMLKGPDPSPAANRFSDALGILPTLGLGKRCCNDGRQRSHLDVHSEYSRSDMDRLSDPPRCWTWLGNADSKHSSDHTNATADLP